MTLVKYGNYECPYTRKAHPVVRRLDRELGDRFRFVFRNFPLTKIHPHAQNAAEVEETAVAHAQFWEMDDTLFDTQPAVATRGPTHYAARVCLGQAKFERVLAEYTYTRRVREDIRGGLEREVGQTS